MVAILFSPVVFIKHISLPIKTFGKQLLLRTANSEGMCIVCQKDDINALTHWPLWDVAVIFKVWFSNSLYRVGAWDSLGNRYQVNAPEPQ